MAKQDNNILVLNSGLTNNQHKKRLEILKIKRNNEEKFLQLFAEKNNISLQEAKHKINTLPEIKAQFEKMCDTIIENELFERDQYTSAHENKQLELQKIPTLSFQELENKMGIDWNFLTLLYKKLWEKMKYISPAISRTISELLVDKILENANEQNIGKIQRTDLPALQEMKESLNFELIKNYAKKDKTTWMYTRDSEKFLTDTTVIRDSIANPIFSRITKNISLSWEELVKKFESLGYSFKKNWDAKNSYTAQNMCEQDLISWYLAWKDSITPNLDTIAIKNEVKDFKSAINSSFEILLWKNGVIKGNGLTSLFEDNNLKEAVISANTNNDMYSKTIAKLSDLQQNIDTFSYNEDNIEHKRKLDDTKQLKNLEIQLEKQKTTIFMNTIKQYLTEAKKQNTISEDNIQLFEILLTLGEHNFDFAKLSEREQNLLMDKVFVPKIRSFFDNTMIFQATGIEQQKWENFLSQLLNFNEKESTITIPYNHNSDNGSKTFTIKVKKEFINVWDINKIDDLSSLVSIPPKLDKLGTLPIAFTLDYNSLDPELQNILENHPYFKWDKHHTITGKHINKFFKLFYYFNGNLEHTQEDSIDIEQQDAKVLEPLFRTPKEQGKKFIENIDLALMQEDKEFDPISIDYWDTTSERYRSEVLHNAELDNDSRISEADVKLAEIAKLNNLEYSDLDENKKQAILEAHAIGKDEEWDNGKKPATVFHYTQDQIKRKLEILKKAGFKTWERKTLLLFGFCGEVEKKIAKEKAEDFINVIEKQFQENTPKSEKFDDTQWETFDKEIEDTYNLFKHHPDAQKKFKDILKERYNTIPNDWETENTSTEKNKIQDLLNSLEYSDREHSEDKEERKDIEKESDEQEEKNKEQKEENKRVKEENETPEESFKKTWGELLWDQDAQFEQWTNIYLNLWGSNFPPNDNKNSRLKFEIISTPITPWIWNFTIKVYNSTSDFEGMDNGITKTIPATAEMLKNRISQLGPDNVKKVSNHNTTDFQDSLNTLNNAGLLWDKSTIFGPERTFVKNGKFMKKTTDGEEEVHYFSRTGNDHNNYITGWKSHSYKINGIKNGNVNFESTWLGPDNNSSSKDKEYSIHRTLPLSDFMLLMEDKQLSWEKEAAKDNLPKAKNIPRDPNKWKFTRYSISSIRWGITGWWKKVWDEKLKAREEEQKESFMNLMYSDEGWNLFNKGAKLFGAIGLSDTADAFQMAKMEYYSEREDRTWKMINKYYQFYDKDPHFATLWRWFLEPLMKKDPTKIRNTALRYQFAAALLIIMKKDGPWNTKLEGRMGKWEWVERFLGPEHKKKFKNMLDLKQRELSNHEKLRNSTWKNPKAEQLNRFEFDYIIGVIDGRAPAKWDDEHYYASIWWRKFASELEWATDKYFGWIAEKAEEIKNIQDFSYCQQEYYRNIDKMKPHKGIPYLIQMLRCPANEEERNMAKWALIGAMISWLLWTHADTKVRWLIKTISRTIAFPMWLWAKDTDHSENTWIILKHITKDIPEHDITKLKANGKPFSIHSFSLSNNEGLKEFLSTDFWKYWKGSWPYIMDMLNLKSNTSQIGNNSLFSLAEQNTPEGKIAQKILKDEHDLDSIDNVAREKYEYNTDAPWLSNKSIVRSYIPSRGQFQKHTDDVDIEAAKNFWSTVSQSLPTTITSKSQFRLIFSRFHGRFSEDVFNQGNLSQVLKTIPVVQELKHQWREDEAKYVLRYALYGNIIQSVGWAPTEFSSAINKFVEMTYAWIEQFDLWMAKEIFWNYTNTVERDMKDNRYDAIKNPTEWKDFKEYIDISDFRNEKSSTQKQNFREKYGDNSIWENIKHIREYLWKQNLSNEEPTPPWKTEFKQLAA